MNVRQRRWENYYWILLAAMLLASCAPPVMPRSSIPSIEYTRDLKNRHLVVRDGFKSLEPRPFESPLAGAQATGSWAGRGAALTAGSVAALTGAAAEQHDDTRAGLRFVADENTLGDSVTGSAADAGPNGGAADPAAGAGYRTYPSSFPDRRDYNGPLSLGDPGVSASLWKESRGSNDIFRDDRAWQPMDLITIVVSEKSEGSKEADTEIKSKSSVEAVIEEFLGFEDDLEEKDKKGIDPKQLIQASTTNDFKGEGETTRKGKLTAKISAMVAEVLPSGILRIEGEKIIAVNSEEQIMKISGLVRPRDITSENEVDSSKIADMRIDYYGQGTVGEAQSGGWLGRLVRKVWPF